MDVEKLLRQLIRYRSGERDVWSVVRVPTPEAEDNRQLHRELLALKKDRTRHINRIKSFLVEQGIRMKVRRDFLKQLDRVRKWHGSAIPASLSAWIQREYRRLELVQEQIRELERERAHAIRHAEDESVEVVSKLLRLRAIGQNGSWLFGMEFFSLCTFNNRKEVGALAGLVPMARQSGGSYREQGTLAPAPQVQVSAKPATAGSGRWRSRLPEGGSGSSRRAS